MSEFETAKADTLTTTLVVGATGMTGRSLVDQLLENNHEVRVVVRSRERLSADVLSNPNATVIESSVLDLTDEDMAIHVKNCGAVISCLGHVMDFKGMFREPKKLCTDATRRLCDAIEKNDVPEATKFILMNTAGVENPGLGEKRTWIELVENAELWNTWKFRRPVIMNSE